MKFKRKPKKNAGKSVPAGPALAKRSKKQNGRSGADSRTEPILFPGLLPTVSPHGRYNSGEKIKKTTEREAERKTDTAEAERTAKKTKLKNAKKSAAERTKKQPAKKPAKKVKRPTKRKAGPRPKYPDELAPNEVDILGQIPAPAPNAPPRPESEKGGKGASEQAPPIRTPTEEPPLKEKRWIKVMPVIGGADIGRDESAVRRTPRTPASFHQLLDSVYGTGMPFRFVIMNCESTSIKGRMVLNYLIEAPTATLAERFGHILRGHGYHTELVDPPAVGYDTAADLQMSGHYTLPIIPLESDQEPTLASDTIAGVLSGGGALEVVVQADPKARFGMTKYIRDHALPGGGIMSEMLRAGTGILEEGMVNRNPKEISRTAWFSERTQQRKEELRGKTQYYGPRLRQNHFACAITTYGNRGQPELIASTLPSFQNSLMVHRIRSPRGAKGTETRGGCSIPPVPANPKRRWYAQPLRKLAISIPMLAMLGSLAAGTLIGRDPLAFRTVDIAQLVFFLGAAFAVWAFWRVKRPIVLTTRELAYIVSPPVNIMRHPIELAPPEPEIEVLPEAPEEIQGEYAVPHDQIERETE